MKIFIIDKIDPPKEYVAFLNPLWEVIRELSEMGYEIHVISSERGRWHNVYFHKLILSKKWPFVFQAISYLFSVIGALMLAKKYKLDVAYFRSANARIIALLLKRFLNLKYICEVHGIEYYENEYSENKLNIFMKWILKIKAHLQIVSAKKADGVRVVTEELKRCLLSYGVNGEKIDIIENGVNPAIFKPLDNENAIKELKKELGIGENDKVVMFEGYFYPWQGVEYLIKASRLVLKEKPNTKFLIVGEGEMMHSWKKLASDLEVDNNFIFTGAVPYKDVRKYINVSDICVAPFIKERNLRIGLSPLKIYEYGACGKPIVSSRIPNLEFIEQNKAGLLVEPEKPEKLAKAIIKLLKDERLRRELGENGRKYVTKNHSWEAVARKVAEVCKSVVVEHENKRR